MKIKVGLETGKGLTASLVKDGDDGASWRTAEQMSEFLDVSKATVRRQAKAGTLERKKEGGRVYYRRPGGDVVVQASLTPASLRGAANSIMSFFGKKPATTVPDDD